MVEIINLRRARKTRSRQEADKQAAENRASFGRTRQEKDSSKAETARAALRLDGHKREE